MSKIDEITISRNIRTLPEIKLNSLGNRNRKQRFWLALKSICRSYVDNTTQVHGLFYLRQNERIGFKRIFWPTTMIILLIFGAVIFANLIRQFFEAPFEITVGHSALLLSIPFPGISLCHPQTVVKFKAQQFVDKIKIPDGFTKKEILDMLPTALGIFNENQWGIINTNYLTVVNEVMELNKLNVLDTVKAVGVNCSEFVKKCSFNKKRFPCFQDDEYFTFRETMSHIGICCSFNYNPTNSSYEPMKTNSFGVRGGLSLIGTSFPHINDGASGLLFSDGFFLFIHPPYDYPTEESTMALLEVGKITSIGVYPSISTVSSDVLALPLQARKCLTGSDTDSNVYRQTACTIDCMRNFIYDKCDCHPYFLPKDKDSLWRPDCTVLDGECFQKIYYERKKIRCTSCLPACYNIAYKISTGTVPYSFANTSVNPMYEKTNVTNTEFTAHTYFAGSNVPVRRAIISQSFIDLMSNFGGVFNLVLGISVFSIIEFLYYFCIKIPMFMKQYEKFKPVITTIRPVNIKDQ